MQSNFFAKVWKAPVSMKLAMSTWPPEVLAFFGDAIGEGRVMADKRGALEARLHRQDQEKVRRHDGFPKIHSRRLQFLKILREVLVLPFHEAGAAADAGADLNPFEDQRPKSRIGPG